MNNAQPSGQKSAYFLSLTLENVRCFKKKQTLDLSDGHGNPVQWNVIMGNNGTGKTTLLQCLALCEPMLGTMLEEPYLSTASGPRETEASTFSAYFPIGSKIGFLEPATYLDKDWMFSVAVASGSRFTEKTSYEITKPFGFKSFPGIPTPYRSVDLGGLKCYGYGASRRQRQSLLAEKNLGFMHISSLFDEQAELPNAEEWLLQLDYLAKRTRNPKIRLQKERAIELLIKVLPDVEDIGFRPNNQKVGLEFKTSYGWVKQRELSLGYRTLIAWLSDLTGRMFDRYPESPNPIAEPAVVLIDEIDLHLHPIWQRDILGFLSERFQNTQFIVTAHSPLVAQAIPNLNQDTAKANLIVLKQEEDYVVIRNDMESIRSWRVDQILSSELFETGTYPENLESLLKERRKILSKDALSRQDQKRLQELALKIGPLPSAESPRDIKAMELIHLAANELKSR